MKIKTDPYPLLHKPCKRVTQFDNSLRHLAEKMSEMVAEADGVGLAANQIGVNQRVCMVFMNKYAFTLVNPTAIYFPEEHEVEEGCLSLPGRKFLVKRPKKLIVHFQTLEGTKLTIVPEDPYLVQVLCHELDHTNGVLICDHGIEVIHDEQGILK